MEDSGIYIPEDKLHLVRFENEECYPRCLCSFCLKVMVAPILFSCDHGGCRLCCIQNLLKHQYGVPCPQCQVPVKPGDMRKGEMVSVMIRNLRIPCEVGCNRSVLLSSYDDHNKQLVLFSIYSPYILHIFSVDASNFSVVILTTFSR